MKELKMQVDDKILTPLIILGVHILDLLCKTVGRSALNRIQCKMGDHEWKAVPNSEYLRYCSKCNAFDDVRTSGIDSMSRREKRRVARKLFRAIREKRVPIEADN